MKSGESYAVVLEKLDTMCENIEKIEGHLEKMNGRIATSEKALERQYVINGILSCVGGAVIAGIIGILFKIF